MSVSKMKKLTLVAMKNEAERIVRKLMWLGGVEVERQKNEADELKRGTLYASERQRAAEEAERISSALGILSRRCGIKRGLFSEPPRVSRSDFENGIADGTDYAFVCEKASEIAFLDNEYTSCESELYAAKLKINALSAWIAYDVRLDGSETRYTETVFGTVPASFDVTKAEAELERNGTAAVIETVSKGNGVFYVSAVVLKENKEKTLRALFRLGFTRIELSGLDLKPSEEMSRLSDEINDIKKSMASTLMRIEELSGMENELLIALDMARTKESAARAKQELLCTERTVILTGWVPIEYTEKLKKALSGCDVFYELDDPLQDDDVPVHLVNGRPACYFESVVEMYSPPAYRAFDPTWIVAVFFSVIFGMMLADAVYGVAITVLCLYAVKKTNASPSVKNMLKMFAVCGVSCTVWGIVFGSYLGDLPTRLIKSVFGYDIGALGIIDVMDDAIAFLVLSLAVGALHIISGMAIRFYVLCRNGRIFSAVFDEGSRLVLLIGIGLCFIVPTAGAAVTLTGVLMLVLTQGRREKRIFMRIVKGVGSLYGLVGYASDLLSYSRIMALGLSSAVVASVFNILSLMGGNGFFGILLFLAVMLLGHTLNLAINLLGAFVHTSRLQYVEFFGRFFEGGGRAFRPLRPNITHSLVLASAKEDI